MDTIVFANSGTVVMGWYVNAVDGGPLTIDGGNVITISGNNATNIFKVESDTELTLRNLTITQGYLSADNDGGAALQNWGGTVTIDNCDFLDNNAGGAICSWRRYL